MTITKENLQCDVGNYRVKSLNSPMMQHVVLRSYFACVVPLFQTFSSRKSFVIYYIFFRIFTFHCTPSSAPVDSFFLFFVFVFAVQPKVSLEVLKNTRLKL